MKIQWSASNTEKGQYLGPLEFKDNMGEWHNFDVLSLPDRLVFGGACNTGFLESGYILCDEGESLTETLLELLSDLETYYSFGPGSVSRIVCNQRM
jgi:hypothetical protein